MISGHAIPHHLYADDSQLYVSFAPEHTAVNWWFRGMLSLFPVTDVTDTYDMFTGVRHMVNLCYTTIFLNQLRGPITMHQMNLNVPDAYLVYLRCIVTVTQAAYFSPIFLKSVKNSSESHIFTQVSDCKECKHLCQSNNRLHSSDDLFTKLLMVALNSLLPIIWLIDWLMTLKRHCFFSPRALFTLLSGSG